MITGVEGLLCTHWGKTVHTDANVTTHGVAQGINSRYSVGDLHQCDVLKVSQRHLEEFLYIKPL